MADFHISNYIIRKKAGFPQVLLFKDMTNNLL